MYTAVVLNDGSRERLLGRLDDEIQKYCNGWEVIAHHMTINMGKLSKGPAAHIKPQAVEMIIDAVGWNTGVLAVRVASAQCWLQSVPSVNKTKHITIAVNRDLASPKDSNGIVEWEPISAFVLYGRLEEVK